MSELQYNLEDKIKMLENEGFNFTVVRSDPKTLLVDIDDQKRYDDFYDQLSILNHLGYPAWVSEKWNSRSGKAHFVVKLDNEVEMRDRIMFQAFLGSDPKRELLAYGLLMKGVPDKDLSVLFKPVEERESIFDDDERCATNFGSSIDLEEF